MGIGIVVRGIDNAFHTSKSLCQLYISRLYMCSGGTEVTVTGTNLNSVAEPLIELTVIINTGNPNLVVTSNSSLEVTGLPLFHRTSGYSMSL